MTGEFDVLIQEAAEVIRASKYMVALTGAGISTPSGIPDFRSQGSGLWTKNDPMQVASLSAFRYRPNAFFDWLRPLAADMLRAEPNPAHKALADLERLGYLRAVVTQNIDNLHQRAGSLEVIEVHGSAATLTCSKCRRQYPMNDFIEEFLEEEKIPQCPTCQTILKPDIVMFEEALPIDAWQRAQHHFERADLVLVAGSSLEVVPAASLPLYALDHGANLIINTISSTYLDEQAAVKINEDVAAALPAIVSALQCSSG